MPEIVQGQKTKKTAKDDFKAAFKKIKLPDDFDNKEDFLRHATTLFDEDLDHDRANREKGESDASFSAGDQWDDDTQAKREAAKKPTLTFNRLIAFIGQIIGNRRLNETVVNIIPDDDGFKDTAKLREGLVRSIQKDSKANIAYNKALENQVISGIGNFEVCLEYAYDDVFEQDVKIKSINNPFAVVWDRKIQDPTGADATHVFVDHTIKRSEFNKEWPDAAPADLSLNTSLLGHSIRDGWVTNDDVRIVHFWRMRSRKRIVALVRDEDGTEDVEDVTEQNIEDFQDRLVTNQQGVPIMREVDRKFAELYIISALDILEGPYELPISRVPVFRVPGWELNIGEKKTRFGLIRFLKDPQRLHNYWRSVIAEKLMLTPKGNWIASETAVSGREDEWRNSHLTDDPLLVYNDEAASAPTRVPPSQIEAGLIEQAGMAAQDLRDISNLHEASLGQQSNEVSGKAILARQRVGETGTVIYQDNLDLAIEECGGVINQLIPFAYDTARTIKILGEDGKDLPPAVINDDTNAKSMDITAGKYSVSITTGPSYVTKRVEASDSMLNMVNAMPQTMAVAADKIVEAQDWPNSEEIARRLRLSLPPGMVSEKDMSDEQKQTTATAQQQAQVEQQKNDAVLAAELRLKEAQAKQAEALATQAEANAAKALAGVEIDQFKAVADVKDGRVKRVLEAIQTFNNVTEEIN